MFAEILQPVSVFLLLHQWTPLHMAAQNGNVDVVRFLVDKGANVNLKGYYGVSNAVLGRSVASSDFWQNTR